MTDEDGGFAFDELKPGTYKFIFEKAGFKKITKEKVVIKTDEAFQLNIEMIESNDFEIMPSPFHFCGFDNQNIFDIIYNRTVPSRLYGTGLFVFHGSVWANTHLNPYLYQNHHRFFQC